MGERRAVKRREVGEVDGHLLALGGFVVGSAWLLSLVSYFKDQAWEPQGLIIRQWLIVGGLIVPYVASYSVTRAGAGSVARWALRWSWIKRLAAIAGVIAGLAVGLGPLPYLFTAYVVAAVWCTFAAPILIDRIFIALVLTYLVAHLILGQRRRQWLRRSTQRSIPFLKRHGWYGVRLMTHATLLAAFLVCAGWLIVDDNRRIAIVLGLLQTLAFWRLTREECQGFVRATTVLTVSIAAWALALGFTFTPLEHWLLAATGTTGFAPVAFAAAFALVVIDFGSGSTARFKTPFRSRAIVWLCALGAFAELGLRTDHLLTDWLPYHRTFWVAPADFIRNGAWPLWDFPSQYGVLSELSLALWPSHSTWQALYLETAVVLGGVAVAIFLLLRQRRNGAENILFALSATCAIVYSAQCARYPMGWRLYPQLGLRFQWVIAAIGIAFFIHCNRSNAVRRRVAYACGYAVWAISLAWSFESGVFTSCAWLVFVAGDQLLGLFQRSGQRLKRSLAAALPVLLIPTALLAATELVFRSMRGHGPDWSSFLEFSAAYQREGSGLLQEAPNVHGALWMIALTLISVGSVAVAVVRQRRYHCLPIIACCWFGLWGTSVYFIGETVEVHANGLAPIFAMGIATLLALQRFEGGVPFVTLPVRAAFVPFFVLLIAYAFGEPANIAAIRAPFIPGFSLDSTANFPAIDGELAELFERAGVRTGDRVIFPVPFLANKLEIGLTLPFVRGRDGHLIQQVSWLPLSPIGAFNSLFTLPYERRQTYLRRYYRDVRETGWFVTYHRAADCSMLIPSLINARTLRSANYQIARCKEAPFGSHRVAVRLLH